MIDIQEYVDERGKSPFAKWFDKLSPQAAAKVTVYLARIERRNISALKSVGQGVHECRID